MKIKLVSLVFLFSVLHSCSDNSKKYEGTIENWLKSNLNDPDSYEPIDFEVLDTLYFKYGDLEFSNYTTAIQRRADLSNTLESHLKDENNSEIFNELYALNDSIIKKKNSMWNFMEIKGLNDLIVQEIQNRNYEDYSSDQYYLTILSQIEGTNSRINLTEKRVEEFFNANCISDYPVGKIKNGLLIKHKFRAKNAFGGKVVNEKIFELNSEKNRVLNSCEVK